MVRVGDTWRDQVRETGHGRRGVADLERIAALGIRTLRYPVLWERSAADAPAERAWLDRQLAALHGRGIAVVAGLVHHGSGPPGTDLLDPGFGERLAVHAAAAAARHPELWAWCPVNEPLTTARFSCLYGHWFPHAHDEGAFLRAVANQAHAALLAMRAVRGQAPRARFVHTEDIGRVFATEALRDQAAYENGRRWLSLDLLCGRVGASHPWRARLESVGVPARRLDELAGGEAAPDLLGVNHYVTSDRFLDHRLDRYPAGLHGGNGRTAYADVEAVRVPDVPPALTGWKPRLREVWERYRRPVAVTEAHLGCEDPLEPLRWFAEAWTAAEALRAEGADVRAVTAWGLLGLMDWNSLLRRQDNHYEPAAFDVRTDPPTPLPLAGALATLARTGRLEHPALHEPGWWRRPERFG